MNRVDRELAEIEEARAAATPPGVPGATPKPSLGARLKRWAKNRVVRRTSTRR